MPTGIKTGDAEALIGKDREAISRTFMEALRR
jgi:hypothetical protein